MPDITPLLATKITLPPIRKQLVPRPRLQADLHARLILVAAPAGWGKSSTVAAWLHGARPQPGAAWVALDAGDNDPQRFWSYVVAALDTLQPELGALVLPLIHASQMPIEAILTTLLNALSHLETDAVLVLDDCHVVDNPAIHQALQFLLDHLPSQLHLVLTSRADPPLALARLRVRDEIVELRVADLRFTAEEAAQFLRETMGCELTPEQVAVLDARTEGWIAGLQLAALAMRDRSDVAGFIHAFTGSNRFVVDYLADEVLVRLPSHLHTFLLQTSILDRLCAPLCDAVVLGDVADPRESYSQLLLDQIDHLNLFLVPLDDQQRWFRYHHLFADVLRERLQSGAPPDAIATLHQRAGTWYERQGLITEAVRHAAMHDCDRVATLIETHYFIYINRSDVVSVRAWLQQIPPSLTETRPGIRLVVAWVSANEGRLDEAEQVLVQAPDLSSLCPWHEHPVGEQTVIRAVIESFRGNWFRAHAFASRALEQLHQPYMRAVALTILGRSCSGTDSAAAVQAWSQAIELAEAGGNRFAGLTSSTGLGDLYAGQGKLGEALGTYERTLGMVGRWGGLTPPALGQVYIGIGEIRYQWNDLEGAIHALSEGLDLMQHSLLPPSVVRGYAVLARAVQAGGDLEEAQAVLQHGLAWLARMHVRSVELQGTLMAQQVRIWLEQGDLASASGWMKGDGAEWAGTTNPIMLLAMVRIGLAQMRTAPAAQGADEILRQLDQVVEAAEAKERVGETIEAHVLRTLALRLQGEHEAALEALARALEPAEPEGYIRIFVDEGEPMRALLHEAAAEHISPAYVARLLAAWGEEPSGSHGAGSRGAPRGPVAHPTPASIELLSERELEVLTLLATGLSNQAIANKLIVGHNTVKKHLSNIYGKLGVQSRTEALARAREMHLL